MQKAPNFEMVVLGTVVHRSGQCVRDLELRFKAAWRHFFRKQQLLMVKCAPLDKRTQYLQMSTIQCLVFGASQWSPSRQQMQRLATTHVDMVRKVMLIPHPLDSEWFQFYMSTMRLVRKTIFDAGGDLVFDIAMRRKWSWAGHVARSPRDTLH